MKLNFFKYFMIVPALILLAFCVLPTHAKPRTDNAKNKAPAATVPTPAWIDTTPPIAAISPRIKFQPKIFQVQLSSNKSGTLYYRMNSDTGFVPYTGTVVVDRDGNYTLHFYATDDYGNSSSPDSFSYVLDSRPPVVKVFPANGVYRSVVALSFATDEPCKLSFVKNRTELFGRAVLDSMRVYDSLVGFIAAVDRAGNRSLSDSLSIFIDTSELSVKIVPPGGFFNTPRKIALAGTPGAQLWFSLDPLVTQDMFVPYAEPFEVPYGLSLVRAFARNSFGAQSEPVSERFVLDTVPPKLQMSVTNGKDEDMVEFISREPAAIWYLTGRSLSNASQKLYTAPVKVRHNGYVRIRAVAIDSAGNRSPVVEYQKKFDNVLPRLTLSPLSGRSNKPLSIELTANETATIVYTIDGSTPDSTSHVYKPGLTLSKEGITILRAHAIDEAGNISNEVSAEYHLDTRAPQITVRLEENVQQNVYKLRLLANEESVIHYEFGSITPTLQSPIFRDSLDLAAGQVIRYFAVDVSGNASPVRILDDLERPLASAVPAGGSYSRRLGISFAVNMQGTVYWRLLPDTLFRPYLDTIRLVNEGAYILEYQARSSGGLIGTINRTSYFIDWTPPQVALTLRRGFGDSVTVFLECSENASIYYTLDGSDPRYSNTTHIAGDKMHSASDRISVSRMVNPKIIFYADDRVGNRSVLSVLDLSKPRPVPGVPAGYDRVYNHLVSVSFTTVDERAQIFYARHGKIPTVDSAVYHLPITLVKSDTIVAFVIDASGFKGELDTFIYHIDLPPVAQYVCQPDTPEVGASVAFDATASYDAETPQSMLLYAWRVLPDTQFTTASDDARKIIRFPRSGRFPVTVRVFDNTGHFGEFTRDIFVRGSCPENMRALIDDQGNWFCIDLYEFPNKAGALPRTGISWVEATIACADEGKRLCSAAQWQAACFGTQKTAYPYGALYQSNRCPTQENAVSRSGRFPKCISSGAVQDMVGNVWEWVDKTDGSTPTAVGGSHETGANASCKAAVSLSIAAQSPKVGFRCCR